MTQTVQQGLRRGGGGAPNPGPLNFVLQSNVIVPLALTGFATPGRFCWEKDEADSGPPSPNVTSENCTEMCQTE